MDLSPITTVMEKMQHHGASSSRPPWQGLKRMVEILLPSSSSSFSSSCSSLPPAVDLKVVQRMVARIEAVLKDAEEREIYDASMRLWLKDLKAVAYEADDVLDEYEYELLRVKAEADDQIQSAEAAVHLPQKQTHQEVSDQMMPSPNSLIASSFWLKVTGKIRKIHQELEEISKLRDTLHLREEDGQTRPRSTTRRQPSSHLVDSTNPRGREDDLEKVMGMLLSDECSSSELFVIPIVGIGGVGKTTLAQLTAKIVEAFTREQPNLTELSVVQDMLLAVVRGKRFLLVLDDVWEESSDLWNRLLLPLKHGKRGSTVITTTRSQKIAAYMAPTHPYHHLECLSKEDCWDVFKQNAFHGQTAYEHNNYLQLVGMGKQIAEKCKGLPLAAKSLGCLVSGDNDVETWKDVLESHVWEVDDKNIIPALGLSYVRLPYHLKQCFLYTSSFPKGSVFDKDELVRLWMAQRYFRQTGKRDLENVGGRCFDELVKRSFFQKHPFWSDRFVMHDLIHDLAKFISQDEHASVVEIRHDSSCCDLLRRAPETARTVLVRSPFHLPSSLTRGQRFIRGQRLEFITEHMLNVRILCFEGVQFINLPDAIGNLKHLRYLKLSIKEIWRFLSPFRKLPDSVGKLYHPQTLMIGDTSVKMLPKSITNLANLRYLQVRDGCTRMPKGIGKLTGLRSLNALTLGRAREDCAGVEELKDLTQLRGSLSIRNLDNLVDAEKAMEADLGSKTMISKLKLYWDCRRPEQCLSYDQRKKVLENLRPHCGLEELRIDWYRGLVFPEWLGDPRFSSLTSVEILFCRELTVLPSFGLLPSLKSLDIHSGSAVAVVGSEFRGQDARGFPALEHLEFAGMSQWRSWNGVRRGDFPCLRQLHLLNCCLLRQIVPLYHLPSLEELSLDGCSALASIELWSPSSSSSSSSLPSSSSSPVWPLPPLKIMWIIDCPVARFTQEDGHRFLLPPTLHDLYINEGCPLLLEWFLRTGAGIKSFSTIPAARLWKRNWDGGVFLSTKDEELAYCVELDSISG